MEVGTQLFFEYLGFASVSADPALSTEMRACADWMSKLLNRWGMEAGVYETAGAPIIMAKSVAIEGKPTLLLYGHYDVQPAEPLDLWLSPPFEPEIRGGMIYARGATDNKGQTFSHLLGLRELLSQGSLPLNVIVLLEGEEEIGSPNFQKFVEENRAALCCDAVLISDTSMIAPGKPALTLGLRGIACFDLVVQGPSADLHSGMYGGAVPNPALALAKVLARMIADDGGIAIPGFDAEAFEISSQELQSWENLPWDEAWLEQATGIAPNGGEKGRPVLERLWARPTVEINGLTSGYQGNGSKTIIPSLASAKLSCRLVPGQDPDIIAGLVTEWVERELAREGVTGTALYDHGGKPFYTPPDNSFIQAASAAVDEVFGTAPALTREGLSIPAAVMLQETLKVPVILLGLGLPDCQAHAPNESYPLAHLGLGARVFQQIAARVAALG